MSQTESEISQEKPLPGTVYPSEHFKFVESDRVNLEIVTNVLHGKVAGGVFRSALSPEACQQISDNFWKSPSLRQRGDGVPAYYVGTFHFKKEMDHYIAEAEKTRDDVRDLFAGTEDFLNNFLTGLRQHLAKDGIDLRRAEYKGKPAGEYLMRSWSDSGEFALEPHDDAAQLKTRLQHDFEISKTVDYTPVAVNICLQNEEGGELKYWNYEPNNEAREKLGLLEVGYPYPLESIQNFESVELPVHQGDVYFFNGANIHAVCPQRKAGKSQRSTISFLMAFIDPKTVIYWT